MYYRTSHQVIKKLSSNDFISVNTRPGVLGVLRLRRKLAVEGLEIKGSGAHRHVSHNEGHLLASSGLILALG
jgi:hypothetical protein